MSAPLNPWRVAASRAAHPSTRHVDESVLAAIARGLATVAVPAGLRAEPTAAAELLLTTDAYDAWLRDLPAGCRSAVTRLGAETAIAVVAGSLEVELHSGDTSVVRRAEPGDVVTIPAAWRFRVGTPDGPVTTVHVTSPPLAELLQRTA